MTGTFLELIDITKIYPGVVALDHVSFAVSRGEVIGLIGENGAGKSTLMKVMGGVTEPSGRMIRIDGVGSINARFDKVTIYATGNNRLAIGIDAEVEPIGERTGISFGKTKGRVWLTGVPISQANSRVVRVTDLQIHGNTDGMATNLLLLLASTDSVREQIANAITEDFSKDYDKVLGKAARAIADKQVGRFRLAATIDSVTHEAVQVTGAGLFTPAVVTGRGQISIGARTQG